MPSSKITKYYLSDLIKILIILWIILIVGGGVTFFSWLYNYSDWLPIRHFNISSYNGGSLEHLTAEEVNNILDPYRKNRNFLNINLPEIKQKFLAQDWVDEVDVRRSWPDSISIIILERKSLARWGGSENYLIDNKGNLFKGVANDSLIWFNGRARTEKIIFDTYERIAPLFHKHHLVLHKLEYARHSTWILHLDENIRIYLGQKDMLRRLTQLLSVWDSLLKRDSRRIREIHMEYRDGFAVRYSSI